MANGTPNGSSTPLPGWLQPVVQITTQVGIPTVFAGVLLYFVLFRLDGMLQKIEQGEDDRTKIIAAVQDSLVVALDRQTARFEAAIEENIKANKELADLAHRERLELMQKLQGRGGGTQP